MIDISFYVRGVGRVAAIRFKWSFDLTKHAAVGHFNRNTRPEESIWRATPVDNLSFGENLVRNNYDTVVFSSDCGGNVIHLFDYAFLPTLEYMQIIN